MPVQYFCVSRIAYLENIPKSAMQLIKMLKSKIYSNGLGIGI